jgi:hypothetical protein
VAREVTIKNPCFTSRVRHNFEVRDILKDMKLVVAIAVVVSSVAQADPRAVENMARDHLKQLAMLRENPDMESGATMILPDGQISKLIEEGCISGIANDFYGCLQASVSHDVGKVIAFTDDAAGVGWFVAPYTVTIQGDDPDPDAKPSKPTVYPARLGGVATGSGASYAIADAMYTYPISDKALLARDDAKLGVKAKIGGNAAITNVAAGWFKTGLAKAASKIPARLIAAGTAPSEVKSGAAAIALAKSWDKLKLEVTAADGNLVKEGVAFIQGTVAMPKKTGKGAIEMRFSIVALYEKDSWRWVLLQFQASSDHP